MRMYTFTLWSEDCGDTQRCHTFDTEEEAMEYARLGTYGPIRWEDTEWGWTHGICSRDTGLDWYIRAEILRD